MITVNELENDFVYLFNAIVLMAQDNQLKIDETFEFPDSMRLDLTMINGFFASLLDDEMEEFVTGEYISKTIENYGDLAIRSHKFLEAIHEGEWKQLLNGDGLDR